MSGQTRVTEGCQCQINAASILRPIPNLSSSAKKYGELDSVGHGEKRRKKSKKDVPSDGFTKQGKKMGYVLDGRGQMLYLSSHDDNYMS